MGIDEKLHDEIIEAQKTRANLWNWKITLIASISAVGLGLGTCTNSCHSIPLVLCCIPIVCAYTDLLSANLATRSRIIGAWRRYSKFSSNEFNNYESFLDALMSKKQKDRQVGRLEVFAVYGSSLLANLLVGIIAIVKWKGDQISYWIFVTLVVACIFGILATCIVWWITEYDRRYIEENAESVAGELKDRK